MLSKRKLYTLASMAGGACLIMASAAYGCTQFAGKLTVTQSGSTTAYGTGDPNDDMGHCTDAGAQTGGVVRASNFTVTVAPADADPVNGGFPYCTDLNGDNKLPDGHASLGTFTYVVMYSSGASSHCMGGYDSVLISGSGFTLSSGSGSKSSVQVPSGASTGAGKICIQNTYLLQGNTTYGGMGNDVNVTFS